MSGREIVVKCDLCGDNLARYDAKYQKLGFWAYMCPVCYKNHGVKTKGMYSVINSDVKDDINN